MRHAIEGLDPGQAGNREPDVRLQGLQARDRPTNGEFIALVSDKISVKKTA